MVKDGICKRKWTNGKRIEVNEMETKTRKLNIAFDTNERICYIGTHSDIRNLKELNKDNDIQIIANDIAEINILTNIKINSERGTP